MSEFGLEPGRVSLRSAGPITFGPAGILFLADNAAATVFAVDVADPGPEATRAVDRAVWNHRHVGLLPAIFL